MHTLHLRPLLCLLAATSLGGCACTLGTQTDAQTDAPTATPGHTRSLVQVNRLLDDWHRAASTGDLDGYFGVMADDAVFLGTDDWERWSRDAFYTYAAPAFADGQGWTFTPRNRTIAFSDDQTVAWFDELLDSDHMGLLRGSGVLARKGDQWKIMHYNLAFTIPNDLVDDLKKRIDAHNAEKAAQEP